MKTSLLNPAGPPDGTEELPVLQGIGAARELVRMPVGDIAAAGTKPTPAELQAAVLATLVDGAGISFSLDEEAGTVTIAVDVAALVTATQLADGLATKQGKHANLTAIAGLILAGNAGKVIKVNGAGDGLELAVDEAGTDGGLVDGTFGDVVISGGGTILTVTLAADEAYGAGWNADLGPPTKNALYVKLETMATAIAGKVATTAVGVANGVASLDATGKVPAGQLPSYVDDVLEYANASAFPATGETGKVYVALDTNRQHRWSGSAYQELTASPGTTDAVPEGATNKYYTDVRVRAAVMTGLIDTVGTPAATDSLLTVLGKLKRQAFTAIPGAYAALAGAAFTGGVSIVGSLTTSGAGGGVYFTPRDATAGQPILYSPTQHDLRVFINGADVGIFQAGLFQFNGRGDFLTPNSGTTGGLRLRGDATSGYAILQFTNNTAGAQWGFLRCESNGTLYYSGALQVQGNITSLSDRRLKSDIRPLEGASAIARKLRAYRFTMDDKPSLGVIAQELEEILPELVVTSESGMKAVDYGRLSAVLLADNNELAERLELTALELVRQGEQLEQLKAAVEALQAGK